MAQDYRKKNTLFVVCCQKHHNLAKWPAYGVFICRREEGRRKPYVTKCAFISTDPTARNARAGPS
jgi:hypothetical protein